MASTLRVQIGVTAALQKSYAYDEAQYVQTDPINFNIAAAGSSSVLFTSFTNKQLKSITVVPTTAPTAVDQLSVTLTSISSTQAFGTASCVSYAAGAALGVGVIGTATATASNIITLTGKVGGVAAGQTIPIGTCPAFNPLYVAIAGGTFDVVVANAAGTNTQTGYVFPSGVLGGLNVAPGDILKIAKGTDTVGVYQGEIEFTFTPGSTVTV